MRSAPGTTRLICPPRLRFATRIRSVYIAPPWRGGWWILRLSGCWGEDSDHEMIGAARPQDAPRFSLSGQSEGTTSFSAPPHVVRPPAWLPPRGWLLLGAGEVGEGSG